MVITRRGFLQLTGAIAIAATSPSLLKAQERFISTQGAWRKFDIIAQLKFLKPKGKAQAWIPVPSVNEDEWSKALGTDWQTNATTARLEKNAGFATDLVYLEWDESETEAVVEISSHAETRDRVTDFTRPEKPAPLSDENRQRFTAPISLFPETSQLKEIAATITENAKTDLGKAKAIYEWIIEEKSCETADFQALFTIPDEAQGNRPDCTYLNSLFVALARIAGLPAREIFGIRVAPSQFDYESLGAIPEDITAKVHSRVEVWLMDYGWVPVDPDDVRRVIRDEPPGNLELTDPKVMAARITLFGAWEGNWIAYNMANDLLLPESGGKKIPFFVSPWVKTADGFLKDSDQQHFSYKLTSKELPT